MRGVQVAFANGRMEEFYLHCNCLTPIQMREEEVAKALAVRRVLGFRKVAKALAVRWFKGLGRSGRHWLCEGASV